MEPIEARTDRLNSLQERLKFLVDYTALVYHEARNVRHLIEAGAVDAESWRHLITLPRNRNKAWKVIQKVRLQASKAETPDQALRVFENRFRISLDELVSLYAHPRWKNSPCGGNAWAKISRLVKRLALSLEREKSEEAKIIIEGLLQARHNTGTLKEKLMELDGGIE